MPIDEPENIPDLVKAYFDILYATIECQYERASIDTHARCLEANTESWRSRRRRDTRGRGCDNHALHHQDRIEITGGPRFTFRPDGRVVELVWSCNALSTPG